MLKDVLAELEWDPEVDATDVGVEVDDGVVTLTGTVDAFTQRWAAERAALRVQGVRAVANDIAVRLPGVVTDTDIAKAVATALEGNTLIPRDRIRVTVEDGWVTLEGEVDWQFQRREAEDAIRGLAGLRGVTNLIVLKPRPAPSAPEIKDSIERALVRSAEVDADRIEVRVEGGGRVRLVGTVRSPHERREAEAAAWRARGVRSVINEIRVLPAPAAASSG